MKTLLATALLVLCVISSEAAYTEFYCDFTNGDNLNSGSTTNAAATISYTSKVVASGWDSTTGIFTVATGNPASAGIPLNEWASVYVTAGATIATFIARITATNGTTITVSLTAKSGTAPATDSLGATTIRVGGVWKGPNGTVNFPFNFVTATQTNLNSGVAQGLAPRVNLKATATYSVTANIFSSKAGPIVWQGMTAWGIPGDLGKATIDCPTVGASVSLLSSSGANNDYRDLILSNSGATSGTSDGITCNGNEVTFTRCVVHDVRRSGFVLSGSSVTLVECETYFCNGSNTSNKGGFEIVANSTYLWRCIAHDAIGNVNSGFQIQAAAALVGCVADTCGQHGYNVVSAAGTVLSNCDAYNNVGSGIDLSASSATPIVVENCNLLKNGAWGINSSGSAIRNGLITNCGFGSGIQTNTLGNINLTVMGAILITGTVSYPTDVTPWVDPANGDFRINLPQAQAVGRGAFTQTQASYTGAIAYPDVGAGQHRPAVLSYPFSN